MRCCVISKSSYLLDTHAFLWAVTDDPKLSERAARIFANRENRLLLSVASLWEIVTKVQVGRLRLPEPIEQYLQEHLSRTGVETLGIEASHIWQLSNLPRHHRDPFDRIIVAQGKVERLPILSRDPWIGRYPVRTVW